MSVGGDGDVEAALPSRVRSCSEVAHKINEAIAQQRLAAGEADFVNAQTDKQSHHAQIVRESEARSIARPGCRSGNRHS